MGNEVVAVTENELALQKEYNKHSYEVTHKDLMIPKLLLMQGQSKLVSSGEFKLFDLVNNVNMEVVADLAKGVDVLPFFCKKVWTISKFENGKYNFCRTEDVNHTNLSKQYEETIDGHKYKNEYTFMFYVLTDINDLPAVLSFRGQSESEGKKLYTAMFVVNKQLGMLPCGKWMTINPDKKSNAKGTFAVLKSKPSRLATSDEKSVAVRWLSSINTMNVAEGDLDDGHSDTTSANNQSF